MGMQYSTWLPIVLLLSALSGARAPSTSSRAPALPTILDSEDEAQEELDKALKLAAKGKYKDAHKRYRKLAEKYPQTAAGRIAARRATPSAFISSADIVRSGPSSNRVDIVLMGEGYTAKHQKAWDNLAEDVPGYFERQKTFREYFGYLNFIRANLISADDGVDGFGREYDTALDETAKWMRQDPHARAQPHAAPADPQADAGRGALPGSHRSDRG